MRMVLVASLLLAACMQEDTSPEPVMRDTLAKMRTAIDRYRHDHGHGPASLEELVPNYLRKMPIDPVTGLKTTWRLTTEERVTPSGDFSATAASPSQPEIVGINSGAPGTDSSGKRWSDY